MAKIKSIAALSISGILSLNAICADQRPVCGDQTPATPPANGNCNINGNCDNKNVLVEAKAAYFFPTGSKFKEIFGGGGIYGAEISGRVWRDLFLWGSGSYFTQTGHSLGLHNQTRVRMIPLGIGIKYIQHIGCFNFYVGAGGLLTFLFTRDHSHFVKGSIFTVGGGGIVKGGMIINLRKCLFLDVFGDYSFMAAPYTRHHHHITPHSVNLSGGSLGLGIGYRF